MTTRANARFTIGSWDESPWSEGPDLPRLTRAKVAKTFSGDIEGEGQVEYLMAYRPDGSATEPYTVVPGSGTGALSGLRGSGSSSVGHGNEHPFVLEYDLD